MQEKVSISLYTSIGGAIAAMLMAAVMHGVWGLGPTGLGEVGVLLCLIALLVFQISGFTAGISERGLPSGKIGLVVSIVLITAVAAGYVLFVRPHLNLGALMLMLPVPIISMGVFAGVTALRLKRKPSLKIWKTLLILWVTPAVWITVLIGILAISGKFKTARDYEQLSYDCMGTLSILCGPWATLEAKLGNLPNAGEFFSPTAAVVLTIILIVLVTAATMGRNKVVQGLVVIAFAVFILVWALIGTAQMLNCLD